MIYYIGIDPSINSTGICIQKFNKNTKKSENFIVLSKERKLTKKETEAAEKISNFEYRFYKAEDLSIYKDYNHFREYWKSYNLINCAKEIYNIIKKYTKDKPEKLYIVIEGISYGSLKTQSIFDLAGLFLYNIS